MKRLRTLFDAKLWKFLLVGVLNTLVGTGIMFGLYNLANCSYWVSSAANYVLTSILSFFLNKHFTFQSRERGAGQVVRFAANIAVCYLIAYGIAKPLCLRLLANAAVSTRDNVAMLVGMVLFTGLNYLGQRFFAFRSPKSGNSFLKKCRYPIDKWEGKWLYKHMNNHSYVQTKVRRSHGRTETRQRTGVRISQRARGRGGAGACGPAGR